MTDTPRRILRLPEVCQVVGLSASNVYTRIRAGKFPRPIKLGKASGWVESEVQAWIECMIKASRPE